MAALTNTQISVTYVGLLKTNSSTVLSGTAQQIVDGAGTASPLYLSTSSLGIGGSPTAGKELDVTGNVLITGDLQIDNINIDGNTISATSGVVTLQDGTIATTQSQGDNSTKLATTAYVDAAIGANDTLAEILANGNTTGGTDLIVSTSDQIFLPNGSLSNPALSFTNDIDTGISYDASSGIRFSLGASERFRISNGFINLMPDGFTRFAVDSSNVTAYVDTEIQGELTVTGTGQSSFAGQVTIPETPSASTDAASKGYVDSQVGANNELSEVLANGNTTGGTDISVSSGDDITFADDSKSIYGASSDLKIYHNTVDEEFSIIEAANHNLKIINTADNSNVTIQTDNGSGSITNYLIANGFSGAVELYHYGTKKFETTTNGVEVTGTLIDLDSSTNATVAIDRGGTSYNATISWQNAGAEYFKAGLDSTNNDLWSLLHTCGSGLYFDGSNMRLGFGEDTPDQTLHIKSASTTYALAETTGTGTSAGFRMKGDASADYTLFTTQGTNQFAIYDNAAAAQRFIIASNGDVYNYQSQNKANTYYGYLAGNYGGTGTSNNAFGYDALRNVSTGTQNVAVGRSAGFNITTGVRNIAIGGDALKSYTTGQSAIGIGFNAGYSLVSATGQIAIGQDALYANSGGVTNTAVGYASLTNATGNYNTAFGYETGLNQTTSRSNVWVGLQAGYFNSTGSYNIAIGESAGFRFTTGSYNIGIGAEVGIVSNVTGSYNTSVGHQSGRALNTGQRNSLFGGVAGVGITTGSYNTILGYNAGSTQTDASYVTAVGDYALANNTGSYNTAVGQGASQFNSSGTNNTAVGQAALQYNTTGIYNTAIGSNAGDAITTGSRNTVMGYTAGGAITTANDNVVIGSAAGANLSTGNDNTIVGKDSGNAITNGQYNSVFGKESGLRITGGNQNTLSGYLSGQALTTGNYVTAMGAGAGYGYTGTGATFLGFNAGYASSSQSYPVAIGYRALYQNSSGSGLVAMGYHALFGNTTGSENTAVGYTALQANSTGSFNTAVGMYAAYGNSTGFRNTVIGRAAGFNMSTGAYNTFVGMEAGYSSGGASYNTYLGYGAGTHSTGGNNTYVGYAAGDGSSGATTGSNNTALGYRAMNNITSAANNVAIGGEALDVSTSGEGQVAIGFEALKDCTTGSGNVAIGKKAGENLTTGSSNVIIGYAAAGLSSVTGTHNTIIGDAAGYNLSVGGNNLLLGKDAGRSNSPFGGNLTTESNRIVLGDNAISHAYIRVSWTVTSDARDKGNIKEVPHGLDFVSQLQPKSFEFKPDRNSEETDGIERYGFLAQDVLELEGDNPVVIDTEHEENLKLKESNLIPILVNAIKELKQEIETLKSQINN